MGRVVLWSCALLLISVRAFAGPSSTDASIEKQIREDVAKVSTDAVAAWDAGNAARDAGHLADAETAYRKTIALAPNLDHPHRRLCGVLLAERRADDAVHECELALSLAPASGYDKSALASTLLLRGHIDDRKRLVALAREGAAAIPDDHFAVLTDCMARSLAKDSEDLSVCVDHLLAIAPDDAFGNWAASERALESGDVHRANIYLEKAKDAGLNDRSYSGTRARIDAYSKRHEATVSISIDDVLDIGVPIALGWCLLLVVLLAVGNILSDATLRAEAMRRIYRVVLLITGLFFYVSLPLLVVFVLGVAYVVLYAFDQAGATPIYVLIILGGVVLSTAIAVVRALFYVPRPRIEGTVLDLAAFPKLDAVLAEAADTIGTRAVDLVYLTPGTDASVTEQRTIGQALRGAKAQRILVLGVGLFDGMKQRELRSVLAHEYGHFRNADTGRVLEIQRSLVTVRRSIAASRYAFLNPAWWLLRAFTHLYLVVSLGASRVQEMLADRLAIRAYGSEAFISGHRHVVRRGIEFPADLAQTIKDVVANRWSLPNLYAYESERRPAKAIDAAVAKQMEREPGKLDSHPSSRQRIEWAQQLALPGERTVTDGDEPVWNLFPDPEQIERDMTAIIRDRVRRKMGHTISDAEWTDDDDATA